MRETTQDLIIETASAFFAERGAWGTSLGDIAGNLGISKGTLYYHFSTKQALINAVLERSVKRISDRLFAWVDTVKVGDDPVVPLEGLCDALLADESLRVFIAVNGAAEPDSQLEADVDRAMNEWNVMIEVGSLRMEASAAAKMKRILAAVLPFICGLAALNADGDYAKAAFTALVLG